MLVVLEGSFYVYPLSVGPFVATFEQGAVRLDIDSPAVEGGHLILFFRNYHCHARSLHPRQLALQLRQFLVIGAPPNFLAQRLFPLGPVALRQFVHPYCRHLIEAHEHGLARLPRVTVMLHEIAGNGL